MMFALLIITATNNVQYKTDKKQTTRKADNVSLARFTGDKLSPCHSINQHPVVVGRQLCMVLGGDRIVLPDFCSASDDTEPHFINSYKSLRFIATLLSYPARHAFGVI